MIHKNIGIDQYHAYNALSKTTLSKIIDDKHRFCKDKLNPQKRKESSAFIIGTAIHCAILEPWYFDSRYHVMPKIDRRTKAGKELYNAQLEEAAGKIALSSEEKYLCDSINRYIFSCPSLSALMTGGLPEASIFSVIDGAQVKCRPDLLKVRTDSVIAVDVKSCQDASDRPFARDCFKYNYSMSSALTKDIIEKVTGLPCTYIFLAVEKNVESPYVRIYSMSEESEQKGREKYRQALISHKELKARSWKIPASVTII